MSLSGETAELAAPLPAQAYAEPSMAGVGLAGPA